MVFDRFKKDARVQKYIVAEIAKLRVQIVKDKDIEKEEEKDQLRLECSIKLKQRDADVALARKETKMVKAKMKDMESLHYRAKVNTKKNLQVLSELELFISKLMDDKISFLTSFRGIKDKAEIHYQDMKKNEQKDKEALGISG